MTDDQRPMMWENQTVPEVVGCEIGYGQALSDEGVIIGVGLRLFTTGHEFPFALDLKSTEDIAKSLLDVVAKAKEAYGIS